MEANSIQVSDSTAQFLHLVNEYDKMITKINDFILKLQGVSAHEFYGKFNKGDDLIRASFRKMLGNIASDNWESSNNQLI